MGCRPEKVANSYTTVSRKWSLTSRRLDDALSAVTFGAWPLQQPGFVRSTDFCSCAALRFWWMMYLFYAVPGIQASHCFGSRELRAVSSDWQETTKKPGPPATAPIVFVVSRG